MAKVCLGKMVEENGPTIRILGLKSNDLKNFRTKWRPQLLAL
jgi:hypothetical protein